MVRKKKTFEEIKSAKDAVRAKISATLKKRFENPELKAGISETVKKRWQNHEYRIKASEISKKRWQDPEFKTKISEKTKLQWQDQECRSKITESIKQNFQDPEFRAKIDAIQNSFEYRARHSEIMNSPEVRAKVAKARENMPVTLTKPHLKVCELLKALDVDFATEKAVGPYNFDIFAPAHNLLIEVQGDYWHSLPKAVRNDQSKATYINNNFPEYRLKQVWEHECLTEGSVLAKLKHWLNLDTIEQVAYDFGQIGIAFPPWDEADKFLYNWHYQHHGRHGLDIAGYANQELMVLARFTSPHRQEVATSLGYKSQEILELARLCVHPKYQKKNLASWFLAKVEGIIKLEKPEIKCLVSFADSTYNHTGAVYKTSNWTLNRVVEPNYWYVDQSGWVMHKKTLWNHAKSLKLSESDYAAQNGYTKVWGKEKYKFTKVI